LFWRTKNITTMFWRDRERENKDQNGGPPCGQVRVLIVGDSGKFLFFILHSLLISLLVLQCFFSSCEILCKGILVDCACDKNLVWMAHR